jgi:hypothetical protein
MCPKRRQKREGMGMVQNQWEEMEQEVYGKMQAIYHELNEVYGISEEDFNEMVVNSIRKNRIREGLQENDIVDKITQRYNRLKRD